MISSKNFNELLNKPLELKLSDFQTLNEVIEKHPYFQAPKAIQLKSLKEQESYLYNQKLKEAAAYTVDRGVLFSFITSKAFINKEITPLKEVNKTDINNLETHSEEKNKSIPESKAIEMTSEEATQIVDPYLFEEKKYTAPSSSTKATEELDADTPLEFKKEETHSFSEWLKLASLQPIEREIPSFDPPKKKMIESPLIDNFLKKNPKISRVKKGLPIVNFAEQNNVPTNDLMTETLAKVYLAQHNYKKAIQAYKILSLKNPEKSGLFADQIRAIEKLQNNK